MQSKRWSKHSRCKTVKANCIIVSQSRLHFRQSNRQHFKAIETDYILRNPKQTIVKGCHSRLNFMTIKTDFKWLHNRLLVHSKPVKTDYIFCSQSRLRFKVVKVGCILRQSIKADCILRHPKPTIVEGCQS